MSDKTIFRRAKDRDNPFVMIDKNVFENPDLSWKAKGLMGYLLSRPDDWTVRMGDLVKRSPDGMASVRTTVNELIDHGYMTRERIQTDHGWFQWTIEVYETPIAPSTENPSMDKPSMDNPQVENHTLVISDLTETECTKEEEPVFAGVLSEEPTLAEPSILKQTDPIAMGLECKRRSKGKKSWTVTGPEGADPWVNGPVDAFCKLAHMPTAPPGSVNAWARAFEKIASPWGAGPADIVTAISLIDKDDKHKWRSFTSPLVPSFKDVLDVMIARVKSGETGKIVRRRN